MKKILTSPSSIGQISDEPFRLLEKNGFEVIKNPFGRKLSKTETIELGKDCIGIVAGVETLDIEVIDSIVDLKCISRVGVGIDNIDINYAKSKGIMVLNTPDGPTRAVAELTVGLTFSLLRKIPNAHFDLKNRIWKKQTGNLLENKKIGIIGLGRIGRKVAEIFRSLGNPVFGFDLSPNIEWGKKHEIQILDLNQLLSQSDIITIHVPGNSDGSPLINMNEFSLIKRGAFLVNVSRGGVINEDLLYDYLKKGKLTGAAIDVFRNEPYSGKLCDLDNVVLTPHIGSYAKEGKLKMEIEAVENLIQALKTK